MMRSQFHRRRQQGCEAKTGRSSRGQALYGCPSPVVQKLGLHTPGCQNGRRVFDRLQAADSDVFFADPRFSSVRKTNVVSQLPFVPDKVDHSTNGPNSILTAMICPGLGTQVRGLQFCCGVNLFDFIADRIKEPYRALIAFDQGDLTNSVLVKCPDEAPRLESL